VPQQETADHNRMLLHEVAADLTKMRQTVRALKAKRHARNLWQKNASYPGRVSAAVGEGSARIW